MKTVEIAALLNPASAFARPMDVVDDCDLTPYEKRAILSSWAANACAAPRQSPPVQDSAVSFDDILDALHLVEAGMEPAAHHDNNPDHHQSRNSPDSFSVNL